MISFRFRVRATDAGDRSNRISATRRLDDRASYEISSIVESSGISFVGEFIPPGLGWLQSLPDARDLSPSNPEVQKTLAALGMPRRRSPPTRVDLTSYFPAVSNQQGVNASTAFAWASILEYFERRTKGTIEPLSPRFLYKVTRNLLLAHRRLRRRPSFDD